MAIQCIVASKAKWYVINKSGEWLEYADKEDKIEWRIVVD